MRKLTSLKDAAEQIIAMFPRQLKIATPLGLGKPNQLVNLIYDYFKNDSQKKLDIYTALSLDFPEANTDLEKRFLQPFLDRHYGRDYPRLHYVQDLKRNQLPANIQVFEFYFQAGQYLKSKDAQLNYVSLNYTHVAQNLLDQGLDLVVQMVAKNPNGAGYSLSSNSDVILDLVDLYRKEKRQIFLVAVVHPDLPYLAGDAAVDESFFDLIVETPEVRHQLFSLPIGAVDETDHMIGLFASQLVLDDGTLQIGIGSLSDALVTSLLLRQQQPSQFLKIIDSLWKNQKKPEGLQLNHAPFEKGLYGTSEMFMDGFMHLRKAGILKRLIFDEDEQKKRFMHAAFFLGTKHFYEWLRSLKNQDFDGLSMTRISKVNDLYDPHEMSLRRQRKNARFFNTCLKVNLLGGAASDTIDSGQVISGVGGQYNFVAMSQELPDSHSVLMLRSTRTHNGKVSSNITAHLEHLSIPRHLRDIVITEYGIAFIKGKPDHEVAAALIEITDSRFQHDLVRQAQKAGKLPTSYRIPLWAQNNTPEKIKKFLEPLQYQGFFPTEPFGTDFTPAESLLKAALGQLRGASKLKLVKTLIKGYQTNSTPYFNELKRMGLEETNSPKEHFQKRLVLGALALKATRK